MSLYYTLRKRSAKAVFLTRNSQNADRLDGLARLSTAGEVASAPILLLARLPVKDKKILRAIASSRFQLCETPLGIAVVKSRLHLKPQLTDRNIPPFGHLNCTAPPQSFDTPVTTLASRKSSSLNQTSQETLNEGSICR